MHTSRLDRLRTSLSNQRVDGLIVTHPPNIRYLSGLVLSTGALVVLSNRIALVVDGRYVTAARSVVDDADLYLATGSIDLTLTTALRHLSVEKVGIEADHMSVARFNHLSPGEGGAALGCELVPTTGLVEMLRIVKDEAELAALREGGLRLSGVARRLRDFAREGRTELEVAAVIDAAVRASGFERAAFDTIVASGPHSALPHARPTRRRLTAGDGVVLDFGGVYDGYCVDLTRTLHIGPATVEFRRLFDAVRDAQSDAIAAVRPGVRPADVDAAARRRLEGRGLGEAFSHATGHGLGLEVHEAPRVARDSPAAPLVPGTVFTVEPGAYVPGIGGVRLEDDLVVVDGGCELLTDVPIEL